MKIETCKFNEIENIFISKVNGMDYIVYELSQILMGNSLTLIDVDELIEAHFFNENCYIHVYDKQGNFHMTITTEFDDNYINEIQFLRGKKYKKILCRKYYSYDSFGQVKIDLTRPIKLMQGDEANV